MISSKARITVAVASAALLLGACTAAEGDSAATTDSADASTESTTSAATTEASSSDAPLTLDDGVVREKLSGNDMTSIFGTLSNHTDEDLELVSFETSLDAGMNEIHEVVDGVMQERQDPLVIPAGGSYELAPGGDHLMIMGYEEEVLAGDAVDVTLEFTDGSTVEVPDVPVRTINAGEDNYGADGSLQGHSPEGH